MDLSPGHRRDCDSMMALNNRKRILAALGLLFVIYMAYVLNVGTFQSGYERKTSDSMGRKSTTVPTTRKGLLNIGKKNPTNVRWKSDSDAKNVTLIRAMGNILLGDLLTDPTTKILDRMGVTPQFHPYPVFVNPEDVPNIVYQLDYFNKLRWYSNLNWEYFLASIPDGTASHTADADDMHAIWTPERVIQWITYTRPAVQVEEREVIRLKGKVVHSVIQYNYAFQHFVMDELPRLAYAWERLRDDPSIRILVRRSEPIDWFLFKLGIAEDRIIAYKHDKVYVADELLLPFWYPGVTQHFARPLEATRCAQKLIADATSPSNQPTYLPLEDRHTVVFFSRADASHRKLPEEPEIVEKIKTLLKEEFPKFELVVFVPTEHSLDSTATLLRKARLIMGPHGGGFSNLIFAPPGSTLIEIMGIDPDAGYLELSSNLGLDHAIVTTPDCQDRWADLVNVKINAVIEAVRKTLSGHRWREQEVVYYANELYEVPHCSL